MVLTHQCKLPGYTPVPVRELNRVHAKYTSAEGKRQLVLSASSAGWDKILGLTKMMVMTVKSMIDRPWRKVSSACLTASRAWTTPACCCFRPSRSFNLKRCQL
jgi:hypothetical protein